MPKLSRLLYPAVFVLPLFALGSTAAGQPAPPLPRELTLSLVFQEGAGGRHPAKLAWSPDGTRLAYLWKDDAGAGLWMLDAGIGRSEVVLRPADAGQGEEFGIDEYLWSPRGAALLVVSDGDLYLLTLAGGKVERLTQTEAAEEKPTFSPDGARVAFVRDFDLHVLDLASRKERALTDDGEENKILNGTTDWVYWEELWGRSATGFWWSPDGGRIAYYRFDESPVPVYPLVDELPVDPQVKWQKYPKAGEANPLVRVGVFDLASGVTTWLETGGAPDDYLARVHWVPGGERVAVEHLNREQTKLALLLCGAGDGKCAPLHAQEQPIWVDLENDFRFLPDGRFVWGAEDEGLRRLYLHAAGGERLRALTPEGWALASLEGVDEERGEVVVTAYRASGLGAAARQVLRLPLEGQPERPEPRGGWSTALVAPRTGHWVHGWSDANTPERQAVLRRDGSQLAVLPSAPPLFDPAAAPRWKTFTIPGPPAPSGTERAQLPVRLLEPAGFAPDRRWPVVMYHYGGPAAQVVVDRWEGHVRGLFHRAMAQRGYAVLLVDNEASIFFNRAGKERLHRRFGEVELAAQLAGVAYLEGLGWADPARIGLWGWSGGGANTLYALFNQPGVWRAGVAGAPVTDWRLYDSIWTERYLDHPRDNAEGYAASSSITYAARLADHLLVVHGTGDDNVHPQNSTVLAQKLIEAGRPFEEAFYPNQKHGMGDTAQRHFYTRMAEFFDRHLRGPVCADPTAAPVLAAPPEPTCGNDALTRYDGLLVLGPHPDDEVLGFGGLAAAYRALGKPVATVVVTDGDAYCGACRVWKGSSMRGPTCDALDLSNFATAEVDSFAEVRRGESTAAAAHLGLPPPAFLGYPDTGLGAAWANVGAGDPGKPLRRSDFGKCRDCETCPGGYGEGPATDLTAATLMASLRERLAATSPRTLVATTHWLDGHGDHAALGSFVRKLNAELDRPRAVAYGVIHAHTPKSTPHPDCWYPAPQALACDCMDQACATSDPAWIGALARHRFRPDWPAALPDDAPYGPETQLCLPERLYRGEGAVKLAAVRAYGSQLGTRARSGSHPAALDGIMDCSGYLMSFVRRTEAFVLEEAGGGAGAASR